jgi:hypothetical protein
VLASDLDHGFCYLAVLQVILLAESQFLYSVATFNYGCLQHFPKVKQNNQEFPRFCGFHLELQSPHKTKEDVIMTRKLHCFEK